jgi:hypothetical protein
VATDCVVALEGWEVFAGGGVARGVGIFEETYKDSTLKKILFCWI